jgi:hypothetical protein
MRVSILAIGLICLASMALAEEPKSNAVAPTAEAVFEWQVVSTGSRKMLEVQRETAPTVKAAVPQFLQLVATDYPGKPVMYGAMSLAGGTMTGQGPAAPSPYQTMYHVTSASSFYKYNVSDDWKKMTAEKLSRPGQPPIDWQSTEVFDAWKVAVTNGQDIPADMTLPDSTGLMPIAWVSPDPRMVRPSSSNRLQGDDDFFTMCHVLSLAPEWYSDGLVNLHYDELNQTMIRPVSFDGMLSPLWVQRPPNQSAATGGDAIEALNKDVVRLSAMGPAQAYIVTPEMTTALKQAATEWPVDVYSDDLDKVAKGAGPAVTLLGQQQTSIVEEVRRSRRAADAAFRDQAAPPAAAPSAAVAATAAPRAKIAMTNPPLPTGQSNLASPKALADEMVAWAKGRHVLNRGQRFPAERFREEAERSPAAAQAIIEAATMLLRNSDDPAVLQMVAQLGPDTSYRPFYEALLDRLEAKRRPLPDAPGLRTKTIRGDLMLRLTDHLPATDPKLSPRAHALLAHAGRHDIRLAMFLEAGRYDMLVDTLGQAASSANLDPWIAARVALAVAREQPERLQEATAQMAQLPAATRDRFMQTVRRAVPDWYATHEQWVVRLFKTD